MLAALGEIESKASSLSSASLILELEEPVERVQPTEASLHAVGGKKPVPSDIDDGRVTMHKLFVDSKLISQGDFDLCWQTPNLHLPPGRPLDPFVQLLADNQLSSALPEDDFKIIQQQLAASVGGELKSPSHIAGHALTTALFPHGDPAPRA